MKKVSRMGFVRGGILLTTGIALGACGKKEIQTGYQLELTADGRLVDKWLSQDSSSAFRSVAFSFDSARSGGSLQMETCFKRNGLLRIVSQEESPNPRWLTDQPFGYKSDCLVKYPVTRLAIGDREQVYVGVVGLGQPIEQTYKNMRVYEITRDTQGLNGKFLGLRTVDPSTIKIEP